MPLLVSQDLLGIFSKGELNVTEQADVEHRVM